MELSPTDIALIITLIIIIPLGIWNQKRMNKKKRDQELYGDDESEIQNNQSQENNTQSEKNSSAELEEQAKKYIETYKSQYPKESIEQGLIQLGISNQEAKNLINKYW